MREDVPDATPVGWRLQGGSLARALGTYERLACIDGEAFRRTPGALHAELAEIGQHFLRPLERGFVPARCPRCRAASPLPFSPKLRDPRPSSQYQAASCVERLDRDPARVSPSPTGLQRSHSPRRLASVGADGATAFNPAAAPADASRRERPARRGRSPSPGVRRRSPIAPPGSGRVDPLRARC